MSAAPLARWRRLLALQQRLLRDAELRCLQAEAERRAAHGRLQQVVEHLQSEQMRLQQSLNTGAEATRLLAAQALLQTVERRRRTAAQELAVAQAREQTARERRLAADIRRQQWERIVERLAADAQQAAANELQRCWEEFSLRQYVLPPVTAALEMDRSATLRGAPPTAITNEPATPAVRTP
jgi:flagellar biosynthesis chaperone FliJ